MFCILFWYFLPISSPFPYIPFHYYLYSPSEWEHTIFVFLWFTYFTQHNTFQFHPRWRKWWLFVISNGWASPPFLCLHLGSLPWYKCYCFNKWLSSLCLPLCSITFLVFKASTWDCIRVIAFLTLAWLDFSSFISTVRDSLVFFCAHFPAQLLSL